MGPSLAKAGTDTLAKVTPKSTRSARSAKTPTSLAPQLMSPSNRAATTEKRHLAQNCWRHVGWPGRCCVKDPNPLVCGRGLSTLAEAGIEVVDGCLLAEAHEVNRRFFFAMTEARPFVTLKWAQSLDGFVDPDERAAEGRGGHPLTGAASARHTHALRAIHDGILVGMRTWLVDRPALSTRHVPGRSPRAFILTSGTSPKPHDAPMGQDTATLVVPQAQCHAPALDSWREGGYHVLGIQGLSFSETWWSDFRAQTSIHACMVEGGAQVAGGVLSSGVWDEVHVLTAPVHLNAGLKAPAWPVDDPTSTAVLGEDQLRTWQAPHSTTSPC